MNFLIVFIYIVVCKMYIIKRSQIAYDVFKFFVSQYYGIYLNIQSKIQVPP